MKITTIGLDLAKVVFQIHGVDERGKVAARKQLKRAEMSKYFANLEPCLIGMEACGSAHYWARKLEGYGHTVKLMAPQFVKPYVKTNKNDMADVEAICEAVSRPNMRFVAIKNGEQQAILSVHRARQGFVKARTAQGNQIRGLLSEFGIVIPKGITSITKQVPEILEDGENGLPGAMRNLIERLATNLKEMDQQVKELEAQIQKWHRENEASSKQNLLGISKRGDTYLRTLLIHGARSVINASEKKAEPESWLKKLMVRRNTNVAAVALANKNARIIWALLAHGRTFHPDYKFAQTANS